MIALLPFVFACTGPAPDVPTDLNRPPQPPTTQLPRVVQPDPDSPGDTGDVDDTGDGDIGEGDTDDDPFDLDAVGSCAVDACGGDVVGTWNVAAECNADWSLDVFAELCPGARMEVVADTEETQLELGPNGDVTWTDANVYSILLDVPAACLAPGGSLHDGDFHTGEDVVAAILATGTTRIESVDCAGSLDTGISCAVGLKPTSHRTLQGTYQVDGGVLRIDTPTGTAEGAFCVSGGELTWSGRRADGTDVGLRAWRLTE